ncbi:MAG TPA: hypothetical protein VGX68_11380 [Thermoanaerobaculia bacterium]|nr:hypothetical protein [Thermoanaerobaculia bacterium]
MDERRCHGLSRIAGLDPLRLQAVVFLTRLLRLTLGTRTTAGASTLELRFRHAHHLVGDPIRFLLVNVCRAIYRQLRLNRSRLVSNSMV